MTTFRKQARRLIKRYTMGWRGALIERSPPWARRSFGRTASYLDMLLFDHGIFRLIYVNRHPLGQNAWRSAQPTPRDIRELKREGVRTIVNLRGDRSSGSFWLEEAACAKAGIALVGFTLRSRAAPSREEVRGAAELFTRIEYPVLLHCKSGADRAGLMSTLFLHLHEGMPIEQARRQLSLRFGHIRHADTGILDYFFERYLEDNRREPMAFMQWVETVYDPDELKRAFVAKGWANTIVNKIIRRE